MSIGAVAAASGAPLAVFAGFAAAVAAVLVGTLAPGTRASAGLGGDRTGRALVALAVVAIVLDRHLLVSSRAVAPDDVLAAAVVVGAVFGPRGARWRAAGAGLAVAAYVVASAILVAATPYRSDAVVAAHGGAELLLAGRHPYADFDMTERLARFGLPPTFATPLEDGTRLRSLNYPALAVLVPAPLIAAGLADVRVLYLAEVLALIALVVLGSGAPRALALAVGLGDLVVLDQSVVGGVDPLWALLLVAAWLLRGRRASALLVGLAVADRQPAWLVAPFLIVWAWSAFGRREALARAAIALGVAVLLHVPFLVIAPAAVIGGITDPVLRTLEPRGVGPSGLALAGLAPALPRAAYDAAALAAYAAALWAVATRRARWEGGALTLPLLPLWLAWRALQNYFAALPFFLLAGDGRR